jgi:FKBP-type peptidyl-prolyl cis-trans isomerase FkpA
VSAARLRIFVFLVFLNSFFLPCGNAFHPQDSTSVHLKIDSAKIRTGDFLTLHLMYKTEKDSVLYDTRWNGAPIRFPLGPPVFAGCIEEFLMKLSAGDSSVFMVNADSVFEKTFQSSLPDFIRKGSGLTFFVHLLQIQSQEEVEREIIEENARKKILEDESISVYLKKFSKVPELTPNGVYYISEISGSGARPSAGKGVKVKYTAQLIDGTDLGSPADKDPVIFKMGRQDMIRGFEEGISMMSPGGKAVFVVPSRLGLVSMPDIPVIFEVELLAVY